MSAETTKVDVLAVMREHIETAEAMVATQGNLYGAEELLERAKASHAAVAELIEAARDCMDCELSDMACVGSMAPAENALGKLQAALARIGGGA